MIGRLRENCYRIVSYLQEIKRLVKRDRGEGSSREPSSDATGSQHLENKVAEEAVKVKKVRRSRKKKAKRSKGAKGSSAKKRRAKRSRKRIAKKAKH